MVHRFYPANLYDSDPKYKESIEFRRLYSARLASQEHSGPWWTHFLDEIEKALPGHDVQDWTYLPHDNCWRCRVYLPGAKDRTSKTASVALLSILAPVYVVYTSHVDFDGSKWRSSVSYQPRSETSAQGRVIESLITSIFDFTRLPPDVLFTPVPDIQCFNVDLGQATLFDCLFTDDRW